MQRSRERRNFVRWKIEKPVRYKLSNKEDEEKVGLIRDVSFIGAKVSLLDNLRLNDQLDMLLEIPDEENTIPCKGKVVWQDFEDKDGKRRFLCGVSFAKIADQDKERMFRYVWESAPEEVKSRWWNGVK